MLVCKCLPSTRVDLLVAFWHISFVCDENLADIWECVLVNLAEPVGNVIESVFFGAIVHEEYAHGSFVVGLRDSSKSFLAGSIPHLQFDCLVR